MYFLHPYFNKKMKYLKLTERYQIVQDLGRKTGRKTVLARDLKTQELVVIKLLSFGIDFEWQALKLFEREAETLKSLSHPGIPRYLDYLEFEPEDDYHFALVQSYVAGKTLAQHLKGGGTFSEEEVKELAQALLEILTYLHQQQPPVIHRDIKPSNIILQRHSNGSLGQVHLVDFGSVTHLAAKEGGTITVVGTYGYMPPEQFGGRVSPASDLYSLGATLIYLVTGLHPTELPQKNLQLQFQDLVAIESNFADWLAWLTQPSLEQRLASVEEALKTLAEPRLRSKSLPEAQTIRKPVGSTLRLTKTNNYLRVVRPAQGLGFISLAFVSALMPMLLYSFHAGNLAPELALFQPLFLVILLLLISGTVFFSFRQLSLQIDAQYLHIIHQIFGYKFSYKKAKLDASEIQVARIDSRIIVWVANKTYQFGGFDLMSSISRAELDWVVAEIDDWLR